MALFDVDAADASTHPPSRSPESHKGSCGKELRICGSDHDRGAALAVSLA